MCDCASVEVKESKKQKQLKGEKDAVLRKWEVCRDRLLCG